MHSPAMRKTARSAGSNCRMLNGLSLAHSLRLSRSIALFEAFLPAIDFTQFLPNTTHHFDILHSFLMNFHNKYVSPKLYNFMTIFQPQKHTLFIHFFLMMNHLLSLMRWLSNDVCHHMRFFAGAADQH